MKRAIINAIKDHAAACYPLECCGLIIDGKTYVPCRNIAPAGDFEVHPEDQNQAYALGEITHVVHSHPDGEPMPTMADKVWIESSGLPWIIMTWPEASYRTHYPSGFKAPLLSRPHAQGSLDCYGLVRDYYARELEIDLPDFYRAHDWWLGATASLFDENMESAGFVKVTDMQRGDMIVMYAGQSAVANHAAVFLGDDPTLKSEKTPPIIGASLMLHQPHGRRSTREIYGDYWRARTAYLLRHKTQL